MLKGLRVKENWKGKKTAKVKEARNKKIFKRFHKLIWLPEVKQKATWMCFILEQLSDRDLGGPKLK